MKARVLSVVGTLIVALAGAAPAAAAPSRYEAENATISQGVVESNHLGYSGTGFVNYNNVVGSYVQWTVNTPSAGTATVPFRYANGTVTNRPMDITVNGVLVADEMAFGGTGNWDTWRTATITTTFRAGSNSIRATATTTNGGPNVDYLDVETGLLFTDYQAENAAIVRGVVESNHPGYTGTGFVNYNNEIGSYVEFTVNAPVAGGYILAFRYANGTTANRPMDITVNGVLVADELAFPGTGAWGTWAERTVNAHLNAGNNTVRATATTANGGPNLDRLRVTQPPQDLGPPGQPRCFDITATALTLDWARSPDDARVVAYDIFSDGRLIVTVPNPPGPPSRLAGLTPNTRYSFTVFARDAFGNVSSGSLPAVCTTLPGPEPQPPTAPTNLSVSNIGQISVDLRWDPSTSELGVVAYHIRDHNNVTLAQVTGTPPPTFVRLTNLACNTTYRVHVVATDAAGNFSGPSNVITFTTEQCGGIDPGTPFLVSSGWTVPWDISWLPDGSAALVTERDSFRMYKINRDGTGKTLVGTVPNSMTTDGEGGLMGVAVSPTWNGGADQEVFLMHTSLDGNRVAKMNFDGSSLSDYTAIVTGISKNRFNNGGRIRFGPDGYLYASTGDAQQSNLAQDLGSLNGKILRVTKTGQAVPGNPFGTRIWSYGHRNSQGLTWDAARRLWASEHGHATWDELKLIQPGNNYGWPTCEGTCTVSGMTNPKHQWPVSTCSPGGITFVDGRLFVAALRGQRMWQVILNGDQVGSVTAFWTGTFGRLRVVEKVPGQNSFWFGTSNADNVGGQPPGSDNLYQSDLTRSPSPG